MLKVSSLLAVAALSIGVIAPPAAAQTPAMIVAKALEVRNAPVCEAAGLRVSCTDDEAQAAWCVANNKPAGAMCVASDTRTPAERVITAAQLFAEKQAEQEKHVADRARRLRKATLIAIEIAITDQVIRDAVCAAAKIPAMNCN
jgi:hypothetical protein